MTQQDPEFFDAAVKLAAYVPAGPIRDELTELLRVGVAFRAQQRGRRPGALHRHVGAIVARLGPSVTFEDLVAEMQVEAAAYSRGELVTPVERVSPSHELVTFVDRGRVQEITFGRLRNLLTILKREHFTKPAKP